MPAYAVKIVAGFSANQVHHEGACALWAQQANFSHSVYFMTKPSVNPYFRHQQPPAHPFWGLCQCETKNEKQRIQCKTKNENHRIQCKTKKNIIEPSAIAKREITESSATLLALKVVEIRGRRGSKPAHTSNPRSAGKCLST